jgi:hypothetical protein
MGKRKKRPPPHPLASPEPPNLDGIALHDAKVLSVIMLGGLALEWFFVGFYVPTVGPPPWFAQSFESILFSTTLALAAAAAIDVFFSIYFHFRNRVRTKT